MPDEIERAFERAPQPLDEVLGLSNAGLAERVARAALEQQPQDPEALTSALATALQALDGNGEGRAVEAARRRLAHEMSLLADLLGVGTDPVAGLARHVRLVLDAPAGDPVWQDLQRFTTLTEELYGVQRRQKLRARLRRFDRGRDTAAELRGTEQVLATARRAFLDTWR